MYEVTKTIEMARKAQLAKYGNGLHEGMYVFIKALEDFEALVRADEREAWVMVGKAKQEVVE